MDDYIYIAYGNPREGIYLYRSDSESTYSISSDYGKTYETVESIDIPESILTRLENTVEQRWPTTTTSTTTSETAITENDQDEGITLDEFISHLIRIYSSWIQWNETTNRLYSVTYDSSGNQILINFDRTLLRKLAKGYNYYGILPGGP